MTTTDATTGAATPVLDASTPVLDPFDYQAPTDEQTARIQAFRQTLKDAAAQAKNLLRPSRELSLTLAKLEEASMWFNKGVVFNGTRPEPHV